MSWYRWRLWILAFAPEAQTFIQHAHGYSWRRWRFGFYLRRHPLLVDARVDARHTDPKAARYLAHLRATARHKALLVESWRCWLQAISLDDAMPALDREAALEGVRRNLAALEREAMAAEARSRQFGGVGLAERLLRRWL